MPGPGPTAHQVLVYSGPGVSPLSLSHTLLTLSLLLLPHYTVQPVSPSLRASEPWEEHCALLVIPGGRDLPYVDELSLKTKATTRIAEYVREGGRYLGLCAGAYFAAAEVQFDLGGPKEVTGKRALVSRPINFSDSRRSSRARAPARHTPASTTGPRAGARPSAS